MIASNIYRIQENKFMQNVRKHNIGYILAALLAVMLVLSFDASAQKLAKTLAISGTAMGTSTQLGRVISVDVRIFEFSAAEDQKALLEAFAENGSEGLVNAVYRMSAKGRIAITGTLGYDLKYIREFKMPDGSTMYRFVTDRPIQFAEHWGASRSLDYSLSMGEITIRKEKGKSSGTLMPAAKARLNKDKGLEIETFQNPWNLTNIRVWK